MKQYEYILLDWDGNIADTLWLWPSILDELLRRENIFLTHRQLIDSTWGFMAYITKSTDITIDKATKIFTDAKAILEQRVLDIELFPGAFETLVQLKNKGKHLALVTTSQYRVVLPLLEKYGLTDTFDAIITDDDITEAERKPHPKPLLMALERMGGSPDKAIMMGDRDKDIVGGYNAGMDSILFCSAEHQQHYSLEKLLQCEPTYHVGKFSDLLKIVDGEYPPVAATVIDAAKR